MDNTIKIFKKELMGLGFNIVAPEYPYGVVLYRLGNRDILDKDDKLSSKTDYHYFRIENVAKTKTMFLIKLNYYDNKNREDIIIRMHFDKTQRKSILAMLKTKFKADYRKIKIEKFLKDY